MTTPDDDLEARLRSSARQWQDYVGSTPARDPRRDPRRDARHRSALLAAAAVLVAVGVPSAFLAARDNENPRPTILTPAEVACPSTLAQASPERHGFGSRQAASAEPDLPAPDDGALVCSYSARRAGAGPDGQGSTFAWVRYAEPAIVPAADNAAVAAGLTELTPPSGTRACTDDLGPRFLLVYRAGDRTIGVVIDDYGCRETRLTSDPAKIVAGEDELLTPGVLFGARDLLDTLKRIVESQREPEPLTPDTATRREVDAVADRLMGLSRIPGFAGTRVAYDEGAVVLRWKGQPPATVRARLGKQPNGVLVRLQDVPYSAAELGHAAGQVWNFPRLDRSWMSSIGFDTATGVVVYSPDPGAVPVAELEDYLGVPVTVQAVR